MLTKYPSSSVVQIGGVSVLYYTNIVFVFEFGFSFIFLIDKKIL